MIQLYLSLVLLGIAAVDPVGISIMPLLLTQKQPYKRVFVFLSGSLMSLLLMGLVFAHGFGRIIQRFETRNRWFVPDIELIAALILLIIAVVLFIQFKAGKTSSEPTEKTKQWLKLSNWKLFLVGALIVAVQSVLDVVFVLAMVRIGQIKLSGVVLFGAVLTYALAALLIQISVVIVFRLAPEKKKEFVLKNVQWLIKQYATQLLIIVSLILSLLSLILAV